MNRRSFILNSAFATGATLLNTENFAADKNARLTILHTNDVHSRLDPFPFDGSQNAGKGGVAARANLIQKIRNEVEHVLLLDAGDIFQGTPYFNIFKGEPEMKAMQMMGYDAGVMGNHDFDAGMENFVHQLTQHGKFPIVMCNYGFKDTPMENYYAPYKIFRKGKLKIGVTGVGIELTGLVPENLFGNTVYLDPIPAVNRIAAELKRDGCVMVICISHLGDRYGDNKVSDEILAKESENIDLIIGGHTHRFFEQPREYTNKTGKKVMVNQVGWGGLRLGRLDYEFSSSGAKKLEKNQSILVVKNIVE
ncbi:MAG: bifunctional metallophosphatase/5'-nucleotidase [Chitinophagaceae bacterium]